MGSMPSPALIKKRRLRNATRLHEANFIKLAQVVPCLTDLRVRDRVLIEGDACLELEYLETSRYTRTISLRLRQSPQQRWLTHLHMVIRSYHDAGVAEVLSFQQHQRLDARYDYPNPEMHQPNEKWQINRFLGEWLDHCLRTRRIFHEELQSAD